MLGEAPSTGMQDTASVKHYIQIWGTIWYALYQGPVDSRDGSPLDVSLKRILSPKNVKLEYNILITLPSWLTSRLDANYYYFKAEHLGIVV